MKEKILAAIKAKFPAVNLSKKRLDEISAKIEAKVGTDESQIDAQIDAFNDFNPLSEIAKTDDRIRDLEAKSKKAAPPQTNNDKPENQDKPEAPDDTPEWVKKTLVPQLQTLQQTVAQLQAEKTQASIVDQIKNHEKMKDVPGVFWNKRKLPKKAEDVDAFITEVTTDFGVFEKQQTAAGLSSMPAPRSGVAANNGEVKEATKEEVNEVITHLG